MLQPYGLGKSANAHRRCSSKVMRLHASPLGRTTEALLQDWIALTIARGLSFAIVSGLVYVTYVVEMISYDDFPKCNKSGTVTRLEWVLGVRAVDN